MSIETFPVDPNKEFRTDTATPEYWYEERRGRYWHQNRAGVWVDKSEAQLRRWLKQQGKSPVVNVKAGETLSEIEEMLIESESEKRVFYAGPLAGWPSGTHEMDGGLVLVTAQPKLLDPAPGEWPVLGELLENLLVDEESQVDQRPQFYGWLKHTLESLYNAWWSRGLCMVLAGDPECGKSLLVDVVKVLMGGRCAKPYRYMIGQDGFNEEMFEAPLLIIDDENADTGIKARRHFSAEIKQIVANSTGRCRGMHQKAKTLQPLWRIMVCVNMEPDNLLVLPPVDDDIADKLMLLKAYKRPMPMPVRTQAEQRVFWERLEREMPSFVHWLLNDHDIDEDLGGRFGIKAWHHPEILRVLDEMSPFMRLHQLIEQAILGKQACWSGTPTELEQELKREDNGLAKDERGWVPQPAWLGRHLERLYRRFGASRYDQVRRGDKRVWTIFREGYVPERQDEE